MFAASGYEHQAATTAIPTFIITESVLLVCGVVMTFQATRPLLLNDVRSDHSHPVQSRATGLFKSAASGVPTGWRWSTP